MACKAVLAKYFLNLPSRRLLAVRLAISSHNFFAVVTFRNLFYFLLSNVTGQARPTRGETNVCSEPRPSHCANLWVVVCTRLLGVFLLSHWDENTTLSISVSNWPHNCESFSFSLFFCSSIDCIVLRVMKSILSLVVACLKYDRGLSN